MKLATEILICFGIPFFAILFYIRKFSLLESSLFKIGLANTINFSLLIFQVISIRFWGMSGLHLLIFGYLVFITPILSIGFCYYIWANREDLFGYSYALASSLSYLGVFLIFILGFSFQIPSSPIASTGQASRASSQSSISSGVSGCL